MNDAGRKQTAGSPVVLISVVIPVRDRLELLQRTLGSLRRQSWAEFEVVIVDDGSTGDVGAVAAGFADLTIRVLRSDGSGANRARNLGTDAARGRFVAYLDSDDLFLPDKLLHLAPRLQQEDPDILISAGYVWRGSERLQVKPSRPPAPDEDISEFYFVQGERFITSAFVVKTSLAQAVRWDEGLRKVQDPDFMIRLVRRGHRITYVADPLVVLCDDVQVARISNANHAANMQEWLARSGHLLTARARTCFQLYVLAYEVSCRHRLRGLGLALRAARRGGVPPRLLGKALFRILVPLWLFKTTAQAGLLLRGDARGPAPGPLIASLAATGREPSPAVTGRDQPRPRAALLETGSAAR